MVNLLEMATYLFKLLRTLAQTKKLWNIKTAPLIVC